MSQAGLRLDEAYARKFPTSEKLYRRAVELFPSGVTHDARWLPPFAVYVERARGSRKWDVDGNELIDYWMGHGALLLGHGHPAIVQAVQEQLQRGTHYGACHPLEVEWAEWVRRLMPAAERVRFTNSGTEATHLAMRLARAFSGKSRVVKFEGHFHGWHDYAARSARGPLLEDRLPGIPQETLEATLVAPVHDPAALEQLLRSRDDVAAVIVEPSGGGWGELPLRGEFLHAVRELTARYGVLLIFDEVVTGFRMAPGGAQEFYGIRPDLVCLAKVLCGGLPGGAVAGRADILQRLEFTGDPQRDALEKVAHQGTFNANPLTAAAGIAMLKEVARGEATRRASQLADALVRGMNEALARQRVVGFAYGEASWFHVALGVEGVQDEQGRWWPAGDYRAFARAVRGGLIHRLRRAMLVEGVDFMRNGGFLSAAHTEEDVEATVRAFERAVRRLADEGDVPRR